MTIKSKVQLVKALKDKGIELVSSDYFPQYRLCDTKCWDATVKVNEVEHSIEADTINELFEVALSLLPVEEETKTEAFEPVAYSYIRFSTKKQAKGDSKRRQSDAAVEWCKKNNYYLSEDSFEDLGISAYRGSNGDESLGQFIKALEEGKIKKGSVLLVESLDRLSRQHPDDAWEQLRGIYRLGVDIVTLQDNQRYTKGMDVGKMFIMLGTMHRAHDESEAKSKRIKQAWDNKRAKPDEAKKTRQCPSWLDVDSTGKGYTFNEYAVVVEKIFQLRVEGLGSNLIGKRLDSEGYTTPKGKPFYRSSHLNQLLRDRRVLGEYQAYEHVFDEELGKKVKTPLGAPMQGVYPPLIEKSVFDRVQLLLAQASKNPNNQTSRKTGRNLLSGIGSCAVCGAPLHAPSGKGHSYYQCANAASNTCPTGRMNMTLLFDFLREWILDPSLYSARWITDFEKITDKRAALMTLEQKKAEELTEVDSMPFGEAVKLAARQEIEDKYRSQMDDLKSEMLGLEVDDSVMNSFQEMESLITIAETGEDDEQTILARTKINQVLKGFDSIKIVKEGSLFKLMLTDNVKTRVFTTVTTPLYKGDKRKHESGLVWELIDTLEKEGVN